MSGTYKLVTLVGTSDKSFEEAIRNAIRDAAGSLRNLAWFEVSEHRGRIDRGEIVEYQVKLQASFKVESSVNP
ncbi:MAG TPA: dodecin [Candidatus Polarisedimenticolaceae bacterium]|nr:dodecin [Candidatus Polarisedimenticolaceae bacterium]